MCDTLTVANAFVVILLSSTLLTQCSNCVQYRGEEKTQSKQLILWKYYTITLQKAN